MVPANLEGLMNSFSLFMRGSSCARSGPCARDLQAHRRDYVESLEPCAKPLFVVEKYVIGVDGEMMVLGPNQSTLLTFYIPRGYDFQI